MSSWTLDEREISMQSRYMQPHLKTLGELGLGDAGVQCPGRDGTSLDLRGFTCMKKSRCVLVA